MSTFCAKLHRVSRLKLRVRYQHKEPKGRLPKKPSYSVSLSLKVGGGQDEIKQEESSETYYQFAGLPFESFTFSYNICTP